MGSLEIDSLMESSVYVPYVDRLGDGKSAFTFPSRGFIGGTNGNNVGGVVPGEPLIGG